MSRQFLYCCLAAWLSAAGLWAVCGCHRTYYRKGADAEAYGLIREKTTDPRWPLERITIEVDPRSRMFDPFDPDGPPMPPDDPVSHDYMHGVDGKKGYPGWHYGGDTPFVENPEWMAFLPFRQNGVINLDMATAVRLALLHSPEYQRQLETLYLSALDVSSERFEFDTQAFGGLGAVWRLAGRDVAGRGGQASSQLDVGWLGTRQEQLQLRRQLSTGAELAVNLANRLVWEFSSTDTNAARTILDFTFAQPLLQAAGRDVVLESLTRAERALLTNVRQLERYRRGFYLGIIAGRNPVSALQRTGGLAAITGSGALTNATGYIGLLQDQKTIRNQESNVAGLRENLVQLEERLKGRLDVNLNERLQVVQLRQQLINEQTRLISLRTDYQNSLDAFKRQLGLPPVIELEIEDPLLDKFNLIDSAIVPYQVRLTDMRLDVANANEQILNLVQVAGGEGAVTRSLVMDETLRASLETLRSLVAEMETIRSRLASDNAIRAREDIERLKKAIPQRVKELEKLESQFRQVMTQDAQAYVAADTEIRSGMFDVQRLQNLPDRLEELLPQVTTQLEMYESEFQNLLQAIDQALAEGANLSPAELFTLVRDKIVLRVPAALSDLGDALLELSLVQARARTDSITLVPVSIDDDVALEIARQNRRDWMNARAFLVDQWRQIEFSADRLESSLDVIFFGDLQNQGDNPLDLRADRGRLRAELRWDAPFTRLLERNSYRQSLIEYQRTRRTYYEFVDAVSQSLRATIRNLELAQITFEAQRLSVLTAVEQILINDYIRSQPPRPGQLQASAVGATAARDVISALQALQTAQNNFINIWISYELGRRGLDLDLGTMQLDSEGLWIDPGPIGGEYGLPGSSGANAGGGMSGPLGMEGWNCPPLPATMPLPNMQPAGEAVMAPPSYPTRPSTPAGPLPPLPPAAEPPLPNGEIHSPSDLPPGSLPPPLPFENLAPPLPPAQTPRRLPQ